MADAWDKSLEEMRAVRDHTRVHSREALNMLTNAMSVYSDGIEATQPLEATFARSLQSGFISQAYNSLCLGVLALERGFYYQALGLMRFVSEAWLTFWYLEKFPDEAIRWIGPLKEHRPPKAETMLKKMDHPAPNLREMAGIHKATLNRFVHSDSFAVNYLFEDGGENLVVRFGTTYNDGLFEASCMEMTLWLGNMIDTVAKTVPAGHEWFIRAKVLVAEFVQYMDEVKRRRGEGDSS